MPVSKYFKGSGEKVMHSMQKQYGEEKGKQVFYATVNKKKKQGQNVGPTPSTEHKLMRGR